MTHLEEWNRADDEERVRLLVAWDRERAEEMDADALRRPMDEVMARAIVRLARERERRA